MAVKVQLHVIASLFSFILFWNPIIVSVNGYDNQVPYYIRDVAINCGYLGNSTALDGRHWFGDTGTRSVISILQPRGKSKSSTGDHRHLTADPIPYMTARASATQFYYTFLLNPGQKFIRLHFYPSSYRGFEKSRDFFTVKAGPFTLLRNFSASIAADALGVKYLVKEYCLNVGEDKCLNFTFSPSPSTKKRNIYAFVNGIEIISMPTGLYYTSDGDLGACIIGQSNRHYYIDNSTALEMVQRLNIGGSSISPVEDIGMFRRWSEDANYLLTSELHPVNHLVRGIKFTSIPAFTASFKIYQTSWRIVKNRRADKMQDFTWKLPVDAGFGYLVRLHFCDFDLEMTGGGRREFSVLINNQVAEANADVISLGGGIGVPIYRDYMVMVKGEKEASKCDLFISLQSSDESVVGLLHGLEIFKLSGLDNNLASSNPVLLKQVSTSSNLKIQNSLLAVGKKNAIVTGITILLILLNVTVFKLRQIWEEMCHKEKDTRSASSVSCHRFSLAEIISATRNFSDEFLIGKGGFGNVYKGFICGGSEIVAVKRLKSNSKQGAHEFWTEIETLSKIRHIHLVSLIGYCNEYGEMILVYKFMPRGVLADNLYKIGRNGKDVTPLTWEQRLRICIGAARGLDYLHTGNEYGIIHQDVKASNILLDENFVAKISDFGLSKLEKVSESQGPIIKGTFGYLDPDYLMTHKPTRKMDVYAFGIVMLVVLCGRPAIDTSIPGEPWSLLSLFREYMTNGDSNNIIDPSLHGNFSSESLKEFMKSIENCVQPQPKKRPTMSQVVASLEYALELQQRTKFSKSEDAAMSGHSCDGGIIQPFKTNELNVSTIHQESSVSSLEQGITGKLIQNPELQTSRWDFQSIIKPVRAWPWEALRKKRKNSIKEDWLPEDGLISRFSISEMKEATKNFRKDLLIGHYEFGPVYKGTLNGQEIAVNRLRSVKAAKFQNEILLGSKLQHRNLLQLLGFCSEGGEKILVYEYVPNKSLDDFLFGSAKQRISDWSIRQKIIEGIARGLLYLHDDSQLGIIHGDLKASCVLLDANMKAKIANFGLARRIGIDHSEEETTTIVGTFGYTPPEYASYGQYSVKSDVYSFGVLVLEIICGRRNFALSQSDSIAKNLISYARMNQMNGTPLALLDPALGDSYDRNEVIQYINVSLLCAQVNVEQRPTMASVVDMLDGCSATLPAPQQAAGLFSESENNETESTTIKIVSVDDTSITAMYPI